MIGWDQFFKGRMSKEWQTIQDEEYDRLRTQDNNIPAHQTGLWWTTRMIRLTIYFALNEWQVQNDTLHEAKDKTEREVRRNQLKEMVYKMYEAHRQADHLALRRYFKRLYLETITKATTRIEHWLVTVISLHDEEAKTEGSIQDIIRDHRVNIDEFNKTNQADEE